LGLFKNSERSFWQVDKSANALGKIRHPFIVPGSRGPIPQIKMYPSIIGFPLLLAELAASVMSMAHGQV
jgi:hypothetical protein